MENGEAEFSNGISAADANTQPTPHVLNASVTNSNMITSRTEDFTIGKSGKRSEIETVMHTRYYRLQGDKGISRHGLPIIINQEPANSAQSPAQSPSPSSASFPMSPSLSSPRLPAAPTPSPFIAVQTEPHSLLQLSLVTADAEGRDGLQPITMAGALKKSAEALSELNVKLTRRISAGKSKEPDVEDSQIGSPDAAAPSVLLPPPSKTSLIYAKSPWTPASSLSPKQYQTNCDSSLLSFLFCCTRGGHPSSRPPQHPLQLPVKHVTPTTESSFPRSEDNVLDRGHNGSGFRILAQFLPKISRKGRENGNEKRLKLGEKEHSKPGDFFKVAATDVDNLQRGNAGHTEIRGTEKIIDSSPLTTAAARDPTANIITHVSPENSPTTAVRRRSTVFGHHIRPGKTLLTPMDAGDVGKKCLVLDLDETLVHSSFTLIIQPDYVVPVEIESAIHNVYVVKRPGVDAFLKKMGELFEVIVFTASLEKYAGPVLDVLDKHKVVKHRLFRESCYHHNGNYVKDLSQLGRDIGSVIIIDNSPSSYIFHPKNAVPITTWFNDPFDTELSDLIPFLEDLTMVENVTVVLDQAG